ncbi:MAG: hypothetical protein ABJB47_01025 [Actinomycetota bacterium]
MFRKACEATGEDVHAETIPAIIGTLRLMITITPEAIPAMAALMTAAMDLSPPCGASTTAAGSPGNSPPWSGPSWPWPARSTPPTAATTQPGG